MSTSAVPMRLKTRLADGELLFRSLSAKEELGRLFELEVEAVSVDADVRATALLGTPATVIVETGKQQERCFNGLVCAMATEGAHGREMYLYRLILRPWLWLLTRRTDTRIFQKKSVVDILKAVFEPFSIHFEFRLRASYPPREYCVQYRESDFDFVSRLMEQEGMYYYFAHEQERHMMVIVDAPSAHRPCAGQSSFMYRQAVKQLLDFEPITAWRATREVQTAQVVLTDYDFAAPKTSLRAQAASDRDGAAKKLEVYEYPGPYPTPAEGKRYSHLRMQELDSTVTRAHGAGSVRTLTVGHRFDLKEHPQASQNKDYLVLSTDVRASLSGYESGDLQTSFECRFSALDAQETFRPLRQTPRPVAQGPDTAVVVGPAGEEIHTDEHGRVKVHFHWDRLGKRDQNDTCWIRLASSWAGNARGWVSIPRIGDEVVVDFLDGNPDRPIITGSVYNGVNTPPWALPANKTQSGLLSRATLKGDANTHANALRFEDKKGAEQVWLHAEKDQLIEVEHDEDHTVGNDRCKSVGHDETTDVGNNRTESVGKDETISIGANRSEDVAKNESISVGENRSRTVGKNENIDIGKNREKSVGENETLTIGKNREHKVGKDEKLEVGENRTTRIGKDDKLQVGKELYIEAADKITFKTGKAVMTMKSDGTIQIGGHDIVVCGDGKIGIKAKGDLVAKGCKIAEN